MKIISYKDVKLMVFPSGRIYKCKDDLISECLPKLEIIIDPKTLKVYKRAYIYFHYKKLSLTRIIASLFVANPNDYKNIKFKDGDANNNCSANLEWVSSNRRYELPSKQSLELIDYKLLGEYNQAVYDFILHDDEVKLYQICMIGKLKRYFYKSLINKGIPSSKVDHYLDSGYELLKKRLKIYYYPFYGIEGEHKFRKYAYFCYVFQALGNAFVPKELSSKKDFEQVYDYF